MKHIKYIAILIGLILNVACSSVDNMDEALINDGSCVLKFDISLTAFDANGSRASNNYIWHNEDVVYLQFHVNTNKVAGKATYNASKDVWTLSYDGEIPDGTSSVCDAYYFENAQIYSDRAVLNNSSCIYFDNNARFQKNSNVVTVSISLSPMTSRLRIQGEKGKAFNLSGLKYYTSYDFASDQFESNIATQSITIGSDGSTSYIHCLKGTNNGELSIYYDGYAYKRRMANDVLLAGQSGYFTLPTETDCESWDKVHVTVPQLNGVETPYIGVHKVSVKSSIIDSGNGTVNDYGFCYSKHQNSSINDSHISLYDQDNGLEASIEDLSQLTTYYIRAYATNEAGVGYSDEISVTTLELLYPVISQVTIDEIEYNSAHAKATVTLMGDDSLSETGFVFSDTNKEPTINDVKLVCNGTSNIDGNLSDLTHSTTYYVRAYAINSKGIGYSEATSFKTQNDPTVWDGKSVASSFAGGIGTASDPIRISTAAQLKLFADNVENGQDYENINFILTENIDWNNWIWEPVGKTWPYNGFKGILNGKGHIIKNLYIEPQDNVNINSGFFENLLEGGAIYNLAIDGEIKGVPEDDEGFNNGGFVVDGDNTTYLNNCINYCKMEMGGGLGGRFFYSQCNNCIYCGEGAAGGLGVKYGNMFHSFWVYNPSTGFGCSTSGLFSSYLNDNKSFCQTETSCFMSPNYTDDLVDELNKWVYLNDGDIHYNSWTYEIVDGLARPVLIPD